MKAVLVNNSESSKISGDIKPDFVITKIEEISIINFVIFCFPL